MTGQKVKSVSKYLILLKQIKEKYGAKDEMGGCGYINMEADFYFRGVKNEKFKLQPKIFLDDLYSIEEFDYDEPLKRFKKEASGYLRTICGEDDLLWMQYAQHFGVPTRLLDFSSNPLVALYFACEKNEPVDTDGAVWVINTYNYYYYHNFSSKNDKLDGVKDEERYKYVLKSELPSLYPAFFFPEYIDVRMNAQSSRFLIWPNEQIENEIEINSETIMDLKKITFEKAQVNRYVFKFIIPKKSKADILKELDLLGVNKKSLFPGLDSMGEYLDDMYRAENRCKQHE